MVLLTITFYPNVMYLHTSMYIPTNLPISIRSINYLITYLVGIFYRRYSVGFLSTEDDVVPGNNGLKDQAVAMKWIKDNIQYFGGNPESITLTGFSAGAVSVHYHYLSPLSRGLYLICQYLSCLVILHIPIIHIYTYTIFM